MLKCGAIFLICLGAVQLLHAQSSNGYQKTSTRPPAGIFVESSVKSWTDGYANWVSAHPAVAVALDKGSGIQIRLRLPFIDYFAADGNSLYSDTSASANIGFLHSFPQSGQKKAGVEQVNMLEPTLSDYLEMFPKLRPYKTAILARKRPVLLAICKDDIPTCPQQNQAIRDFKAQSGSLRIQVVQVKLSNNPPEQ